MAISPANAPTMTDQAMRALFRSLGDPTRLALLRLLAAEGEARVTELIAEVGLAQSTVSAHLGCLRECGLVDYRPEGRSSRYFLTYPREVLRLLESAEALLAMTGQAVDSCPAYGEGQQQ